MKLFIPEIGTRLVLSTDWEFSLFTERRNEALLLAAKFNSDSYTSWIFRSHDKEESIRLGWTQVNPECDWSNWFKRVI